MNTQGEVDSLIVRVDLKYKVRACGRTEFAADLTAFILDRSRHDWKEQARLADDGNPLCDDNC